MGDRVKAFWLGLFIIAAMILLIWLVMFLKPSVGDGSVQLRVRFTNIDKISKGSQVTYAGRPVGEVAAIIETKDPQNAPADSSGNLYIYELLLDVDSSVQIYSYDEILYATTGLLGEKNIAILPKAPPSGAPPAKNISKEILRAKSSDRVEQTLNRLCAVADTLQETMQEVTCFIRSNRSDFNGALTSFTKASDQLENVLANVEKTHLLERLGNSCEGLGDLAERLNFGEGSLSHLVNSDQFYIQFTTVLCQLRSILYDINHYGVLFQFNRKWKREQAKRYTEIPYQSYCE